MASDLSLAGVRLVIADHAMELPVLRTLSLCTCCRHYPGAAAGRTLRSASPSRISLPRKGCRVGLRIVLFEACSAFTRVTACTLALSPIRDTHSEGFSYFVTSIAAPAASGGSVRRVGLAPTGKRRLVTAHTQLGRQATGTLISASHPTFQISDYENGPGHALLESAPAAFPDIALAQVLPVRVSASLIEPVVFGLWHSTV